MKSKYLFFLILVIGFTFVGCVQSGYEKVQITGTVVALERLLCTCFELKAEDGKIYTIRYDEFEQPTRRAVDVSNIHTGDEVKITGERKKNSESNVEILLKKVKVIT